MLLGIIGIGQAGGLSQGLLLLSTLWVLLAAAQRVLVASFYYTKGVMVSNGLFIAYPPQMFSTTVEKLWVLSVG